MFTVGDKAKYPRYGKVVIKSLEDREVMGVMRPYYILKGMEKDVTIMVQQNMIYKVGLKKIC
ncbi:MAG TPA: CarD family transcriptional regulator [Thermodesulfovibrionales bacterium]|nr:CarD family transcriptional regulator [Thermodesulfovibrionales bacterium]